MIYWERENKKRDFFSLISKLYIVLFPFISSPPLSTVSFHHRNLEHINDKFERSFISPLSAIIIKKFTSQWVINPWQTICRNHHFLRTMAFTIFDKIKKTISQKFFQMWAFLSEMMWDNERKLAVDHLGNKQKSIVSFFKI